MKMVQVVFRPERLNDLEECVRKLDVGGLNLTNIMGYGRQKGYVKMYRGVKQNVNLLPYMKGDIAVQKEDVDKVVSAIEEQLATESYGDGKIFIREVEDAVRIRTGETGRQAL